MMQVICSKCREWIYEEDIDIENVEEGPNGEDLVLFNCPTCGAMNVISKRYS